MRRRSGWKMHSSRQRNRRRPATPEIPRSRRTARRFSKSGTMCSSCGTIGTISTIGLPGHTEPTRAVTSWQRWRRKRRKQSRPMKTPRQSLRPWSGMRDSLTGKRKSIDMKLTGTGTISNGFPGMPWKTAWTSRSPQSRWVTTLPIRSSLIWRMRHSATGWIGWHFCRMMKYRCISTGSENTGWMMQSSI